MVAKLSILNRMRIMTNTQRVVCTLHKIRMVTGVQYIGDRNVA